MDTKKVAHLKEGKFSIDVVPSDWIQCSVSHEYRPRSEFCNDPASGVLSRTNCKRTYEMTSDFSEYKSLCSTLVASKDYKSKLEKFHRDQNSIAASIDVSELIEALSLLPPNSRICVTQTGYYCSGEYADVFLPVFKEKVEGVEIYRIGHSSSEY